MWRTANQLTRPLPPTMVRRHSRAQARLWARSSAVEHLTFNQRVSGSNPDGLTNKIKDLKAGSTVCVEPGNGAG